MSVEQVSLHCEAISLHNGKMSATADMCRACLDRDAALNRIAQLVRALSAEVDCYAILTDRIETICTQSVNAELQRSIGTSAQTLALPTGATMDG